MIVPRRIVWFSVLVAMITQFGGFAMTAHLGSAYAEDDPASSAPQLRGYVNLMRTYILGPNDVLNIDFFGIPELNQRNLRIRADGKISLPALGVVDIAGMTVDELTRFLESEYQQYIKKPQLSINITNNKPFVVYVTGAVTKPGSYELNTNDQGRNYASRDKSDVLIQRVSPLLSNVLLAAGGIAYDANIEQVVIENSISGESFEVNLLKLLQGEL